MIIRDLLEAQSTVGLIGHGKEPEVAPLEEDHALQEAQLIDVRFDAVTRRAALLFDLRVALQLREADTGVLVIREVEGLSWSAPRQLGDLIAWSVGSSVARSLGGLFELSLSMWPHPGSDVVVRGAGAFFVSGDAVGIGQIPPDYTINDRESVRGRIPGWDSEFAPHSATFRMWEEPSRGVS